MRYQQLFVVAPIFFALLTGGCKKEAPGGELLGEAKGKAGGVTWAVPKNWTVEPERPMRAATYAVAAQPGDPEGGDCSVIYFGPGVGGDNASNINRWVNQFENPDAPKTESKEISGMNVTIVQVGGAYLAPGGPMMAPTAKKENFRLLGAIVNSPGGPVFFKLTGPAKTVAAAEAEFDAMINSLSK
jgi:hypothetical protein